MSIGKTLFPPANREAAAVAFLRTFWQTVKATGVLGTGGALIVTATDLRTINLLALAYIAGAVILSGLLSGAFAAGDILVHGLPNAYTAPASASAVRITDAPANVAPLVAAVVTAAVPAVIPDAAPGTVDLAPQPDVVAPTA